MDSEAKIITRKALSELRPKLGGKIVFTSGVFDLLHSGHVSYLESAKKLGDFLIVAVNSNESVSKLKGDKRPIIDVLDRLKLIASLSSVDYVFSFSEENNRENIKSLKPDIYAKAGDYSPAKLGSKELIESYGGEVKILSFKDGRSSTSIIDTIVSRYCEEAPRSEPIDRELKPAIFVDRDGTINEAVEYLHEADKFVEIPEAFKSLARLKESGFRIIVVTNQAGIGFGYFSKEDFFAVNKRMLKLAKEAGLMIDGVFYSPYTEAEASPCRKPGTLLVERAVRDFYIDLSHSFVIGDSTSDIELSMRLQIPGILVQTGEGGKDGKFEAKPVFTAKNLKEAADYILKQS